MAGVAQEAAGVGEHPVEGAHGPQGHETGHLGLHDGADGGVIPGVQGVQDGLAQGPGLLQGVQQLGKPTGVRLVTGGIEAGVRAQLGEQLGGIVPDAAEVELHDPIPLGVLLAHGEEQGGVVGQLFLPGDSLPSLAQAKMSSSLASSASTQKQ